MSDYYVPAATVEEDFVNLVKLELLEQLDTEMSSKLRAAFLRVIKPYCNE